MEVRRDTKLVPLNPVVENSMYTIKVDKNELEQNGFSMEEIAGIYIFSNEYEGGEFRADMEEGKRAGYQVRYVG